MRSGAIGVTRADRVAQVRAGHPTICDYAAYVPVDGAVAKLRLWQDAGARIDYLSSHRNPADVALDALVLRRHGFPAGRVFARQPDESYGDVDGVEAPDVLIEDDCESIGVNEITYSQIPLDVRARITSIVIPEFGGLGHLPDNPRPC
jgi:hypothetical protein